MVTTIKEQAKVLIDDLPDTAEWDDVLYAVYVRQSIEDGLRANQEGRVRTIEEVRRRFQSLP